MLGIRQPIGSDRLDSGDDKRNNVLRERYSLLSEMFQEPDS
jgi:hypothetical protein